MRTSSTCAFIFRLCLLLLLPFAGSAQTVAVPDSLAAPDSSGKKAARKPFERQLRFGIDVRRPIEHIFRSDNFGYEFGIDYTFREDLYGVVEGGWGGANYLYPDLSYTSRNGFGRIGVDKSLLKRISGSDWDIAFIGLRYGLSIIRRSEGSYTTTDPLWGTTRGSIPAKNFTGHWAEITGGLRLELFPRIFVGWNIRGKFLLNQSAFRELAPAYVAGYGRGDKNSVFDFNFWLMYAIRRAPKSVVR